MKLFITFSTIIFFNIPFFSQEQNVNKPLNEFEKKKTIESINKLLVDQYIFPSTAEKIKSILLSNYKKGNYKNIINSVEFAAILTRDLINISGDKHFIVSYNPKTVAESKLGISKEDSLTFLRDEYLEDKKINFGFKELKILDGNIGYLNLTGFCKASDSFETTAAAINYLSNTDAIIIDLRYNNGGYPSMVQLLASYFYDNTPLKFIDIYTRRGNTMSSDSNLLNILSKRLPTKDLYILTSNTTFSAGESFTYIMKNRKRALIIGEKTGGGAHPVAPLPINDKFTILLPVARPIDPITKTDWEGVGITPDIEVSIENALLTAHVKALEILSKSTSNNTEHLWYLERLTKIQKPEYIDPITLKSYEGNFGARKLIYQDACLYYQKENQAKQKLVAASKNSFFIESTPNIKINILSENGKVTAIKRQYIDGDIAIDRKQ